MTMDYGGLSSSIMAALSGEEGPAILPSFRRSQSVTAMANLQHELTIEGDGEKKTDWPGGLERCASLPHLKWKGPVEALTGPRQDGDNISITSAAKSEDRVHELVSNFE